MTTAIPEPIPDVAPEGETDHSAEEQDQRKRRLLLLLLLFLLGLCCCVGYFILRYMLRPQPLPEMVPVVNVNYPPTYKFSFPADKPIGVAISPDGSRIYVAESDGERLIKMFDKQGNLLKSFAPAGTTKSTRQPRYIAVDPTTGRVFLVDRLNNAIHVFDADGNYLDSLIAPDLTLTKVLAQKYPGGAPAGTTFSYSGFGKILTYQVPNAKAEQVEVKLSSIAWAPLGIRFDAKGNLMYSDLTAERHKIRIIPAAALAGPLNAFNPTTTDFGERGPNPGQFEFPQVAVTDSKGNFFISDGNNYRISAWTADYKYRTFFAFGSIEGGLNLPRGMWMDGKDRLHVVDAVAATVKVYDVSGKESVYLYNFGSLGNAEGQMSYPVDICIDANGLLYVADSGNNRIEVWSY